MFIYDNYIHNLFLFNRPIYKVTHSILIEPFFSYIKDSRFRKFGFKH